MRQLHISLSHYIQKQQSFSKLGLFVGEAQQTVTFGLSNYFKPFEQLKDQESHPLFQGNWFSIK